MNRFGRLLRRLPLLLPLLVAACASSETSGGGPSEDRTLSIVALIAGCAVLMGIGVLMYIDNQD